VKIRSMRAYFSNAVLAVAALIVVLWAVIALALREAYADAIASASAAGEYTARVLAEYEGSSMRAIDLTLRYLREDWLRDPAELDRAVARHQEHLSREGLIQVAVVDAQGWTRYSRLPLARSLNFADRDYFQQQKASGRDEMVISAPVMGRVTKQWAIQFSRPIYDHGRFAGMIVVALPPPALEHVYRDVRGAGEDVVTLVRSDGAILARTRDLDRASRISLKDTPGLQPGDAPSGSFEGLGRLDGVERLVAYSKVRSYPLTVYVSQDMDHVLEWYREQRLLLVAAGVVATALLLALGRLWHSRRRLHVQLADHERRAAEARERMMLELHDGAIQSIYAVGMNLERSREQVDLDPVGAKRTIAAATAHLNLVIQDIRSFIAGQANVPRGEREFMDEIEKMLPRAENIDATHFQLDIDPAVVRGLKPEQALHILRIAREGVSNVLRHAYAAKAHIALQRTPAGGVRLEISDDGIGMREDAAQARGLGLHHIGARGQKLSGRTSIESAPGRGTRIVVEFPSHA
jgi:signal transduction histidine kinase